MSKIKFVYRRLKERDWAYQLVNGLVYLPTLMSMREAGRWRQDEREGQTMWAVPNIDETTSPEARARVIQQLKQTGRFGFDPGREELAHFQNVGFGFAADDYLLCGSRRSTLTGFGDHCVRIADPVTFARHVVDALEAATGERWMTRVIPVSYNRDVNDFGDLLDPIEVGTKGNEAEQEVRLAWRLRDKPRAIRPMMVEVPIAKRFCSLMD